MILNKWALFVHFFFANTLMNFRKLVVDGGWNILPSAELIACLCGATQRSRGTKNVGNVGENTGGKSPLLGHNQPQIFIN